MSILSFSQHSLMLQNYWIIRNSLVLRTQLPAFFWQRTHTLLQRPDALYKSSRDHAFCKKVEHSQVQMYSLRLFRSIPILEYLCQGHSKANHTKVLKLYKKYQSQERQLVFKFSLFVQSIANLETILHACTKFYRQWEQQLGDSWNSQWRFSRVWYCIFFYLNFEISLTLVIKSINSVDWRTLVVASQ